MSRAAHRRPAPTRHIISFYGLEHVNGSCEVDMAITPAIWGDKAGVLGRTVCKFLKSSDTVPLVAPTARAVNGSTATATHVIFGNLDHHPKKLGSEMAGHGHALRVICRTAIEEALTNMGLKFQPVE